MIADFTESRFWLYEFFKPVRNWAGEHHWLSGKFE
jgi:hypothetical protein